MLYKYEFNMGLIVLEHSTFKGIVIKFQTFCPYRIFIMLSYYYKRWKICILLSTYFSSLMKADMVLISDFNFPIVTSTPFSMRFSMDVETTHSKRILWFFALFNLMNGTIKFFGLFFLIFFEYGSPTTANAAHFGLLLF